MREIGKERDNKPYLGIECDHDGNEALIVGYFKGPQNQNIAIRKISVEGDHCHFMIQIQCAGKRCLDHLK